MAMADPGAGVELTKRSPNGAGIRIGVLAWSGEPGLSYLSASELLRSAEIIAPSISKHTDLILCAGRRVYHSRSPRELKPSALLEATVGTPIMFEWWAEDRKGNEIGEWRLVHDGAQGPFATMLRREQIIWRSNEPAGKFARLAETIASGAGVLRVRGVDLRLILMICGESNALKTAGHRSVLRSHRCRELRRVLGAPWILLNPSHRPYWPRSPRTGASNVFALQGKVPFLAQLVAEDRSFEDGTTGPDGVVHANTFLGTGDTHQTASVATLAFSRPGDGRARSMIPCALEHCDGNRRGVLIGLRYAEFQF